MGLNVANEQFDKIMEFVKFFILELGNMIIHLTKRTKRKKISNKSKKTQGNDCADLYKKGEKKNGVYQLNPDGQGYFKVFCDMKTSGGGWTVFQRRQDGSVNFYRGWKDYKQGFGDLKSEFWLGLDKIYRLTSARRNKLRVDLGDTSGIKDMLNMIILL
ncbi:ryncolin-4-like [Xenia sp. Carnegie-2017]|uniref:ryncolin-4-like n=1 Tax=Xenia sp. Carnegie-2017 TaxID=2897299 RepID=UPI001F04D5AC|nr:ryncolin-4-like [Xenia sp. Carnegie-2017]